MFGQNKPLFGSPAQPAQSTGLFGGQTSAFGQQQPVQQTGLFGQPAAQPQQSLFGSPAQPVATGFGQTNTFGARPGGSLFGQTTPAATGGMFGGGATAFGGATTSGFGMQQQATVGTTI